MSGRLGQAQLVMGPTEMGGAATQGHPRVPDLQARSCMSTLAPQTGQSPASGSIQAFLWGSTYPGRASTNREAKSCAGVASPRNRVECARSGQSLLASGRRRARRKEGIARSNPRSPHEACWYLGGKQADGTDGFRFLCHQFFPSSLLLPANCISRSKTCSLTVKPLTPALLRWVANADQGQNNPNTVFPLNAGR
jgi:hypothetical protein